MTKPKTQKLPTYSSASLLVSNKTPEPDDLIVEYIPVEDEFGVLDKVFDWIFEQVEKESKL